MKSTNVIRLPESAWTMSWWIDRSKARAALGVAGDDQVVRVLADADHIVGGADLGTVSADVEDEVDRRRVAIAVAPRS